MPEITEAMQLDVDLHLLEVWAELGDIVEEEDLEWFAAYMLWTFLLGYRAASEHADQGEPWKLLKDHGWT